MKIRCSASIVSWLCPSPELCIMTILVWGQGPGWWRWWAQTGEWPHLCSSGDAALWDTSRVARAIRQQAYCFLFLGQVSIDINRPGIFQIFLSSWRITFYWVILRHRTGFWWWCFIFVPPVPALYRGSELGVDWSGFMIWIIENISKSKLFVEERDRETWVALIISWPTTTPPPSPALHLENSPPTSPWSSGRVCREWQCDYKTFSFGL